MLIQLICITIDNKKKKWASYLFVIDFYSILKAYLIPKFLNEPATDFQRSGTNLSIKYVTRLYCRIWDGRKRWLRHSSFAFWKWYACFSGLNWHSSSVHSQLIRSESLCQLNKWQSCFVFSPDSLVPLNNRISNTVEKLVLSLSSVPDSILCRFVVNELQERSWDTSEAGWLRTDSLLSNAT